MEIEKKFLTEKIPFDIKNFPKKELRQCYISTSPTIRLRKEENTYFLTVKSKGKIVREEFELEITEEEYNRLKLKSETPEVIKTRYFVPVENNLTAEVDIYYGDLEGLMTTEVEFPSLEDADKFTAPDWFGKDVSSDNRYKNTNLSLYGIPKD